MYLSKKPYQLSKPTLIVMVLAGMLLGATCTGYAQQTVSTPALDARALFEDAHILIEEARYDSASALLKRAAAKFEEKEHWEQAARSYTLISTNYRILSRLDSAQTYSKRSLEVLDNHNLSAHELRAQLYNNLGLVENERSHFEEASVLLRKALEATDHESVSVETKAMILGNLGSLLDDQGNYDEALEYYSEGVSLLDPDGPRKHKERLAKLYNYVGVTYVKKGLYEKALQFYEREVEMNTTLYGESHPSIAGGYNNIGGIYYRGGDVGEAILYFKKAADSIEKFFGENHPRVGLIYNNIGAAYYRIGNYEEAIDYLKKSAEIKQESQGKNHPDLALTYNNIGSIYTEMEQYDRGITYLQQSLDIRRKALGDEHPILSNNYNSLGTLHLNTGRIDEAIDYFQKGLDITLQARGPKHPYAAEARTNLGKAYREQGNYVAALNQLNSAEAALQVDQIPDSDRSGSGSTLQLPYHHPTYAVNILYEKGRTLYRRYESRQGENADIAELKKTRQLYMQLSGLLDVIQLSFRNEESKLLMGARSHGIYESALQVSYDLYVVTGNNNYLEDIFFYAEKSKARVILELLNNKEAREFSGIPDSLVAYENELRQALTDVRQSLGSAGTETDTDKMKKSREVLQDSLFSLNRILNNHLKMLERNYPKYHRFKYRSDVPTLGEVQNSYLADDSVILEYFYGEESSWAVVIDKEELDVVKLPHIPGLSEKVAAFNKAISTNEDSTYLGMAYDFYQALIKPIEKLIDSQNIRIVPDGPLNLLPFDALLTRDIPSVQSFADLPYLLDRYRISYSPSVALSSHRNIRSKGTYSDQLLAYAPVFEDNFGGWAIQLSSREGWKALPASRYEVEQIAKAVTEERSFWSYLTGSDRSVVYTGEEATETSFKSNGLNGYRYLHLATHAFASDSASGRAGIAFYPDEENDEDGILYTEEIYGLDLNSELVVLSACETASGEIRAGEGIIGLSRAFQYAGAENLLVSLWNVEDRSTARLMINFYKNLRQHEGPGALRSAKQILIDTTSYAHPRYWAPFVFIGS